MVASGRELAGAGYVEGENLHFESRWAKDRNERHTRDAIGGTTAPIVPPRCKQRVASRSTFEGLAALKKCATSGKPEMGHLRMTDRVAGFGPAIGVAQ